MVKHVDSGGQVHLVTNIRKPRKWRRYEYLESSGTLYIDTGVYGHMNHIYEITFLQINTGLYRTWGVLGLSSYIGYNMSLTYGSSDWFLRWNSSSSGLLLSDIAAIDTNKHIIKINNGECFFDGVSKGTSPGHNTNFSINYNLYLFTINPANTTPSDNAKCKIYEYKDYDASGNLVRYMVPAQYQGQYGMWDLVEDKFYKNAGTGTFTVGPEVKNYDEIDEVRRTSSLLPAGVELYDYILSSGTLYIDTGWGTDYTKSFEVTSKYNASSTGTRGCVLSSYNHNSSDKAISLEITTSASRYWLYNGNIDNNITISMGADHTSIFSYGGGIWKHQVDNGTAQTGSASYSGSSTSSAYIFLDRALRTTTFNKLFKMYYLSIKENGVLIRNFIPCTYLGEPGMWDTVENKFYRNQGTGLFTLGNKITLKEYEYLLSSGTLYIDTLYNPNNNTRVLTELMMTTNGDVQGMFGSYSGNNWTDRSYGLYYAGSAGNAYSNYVSDTVFPRSKIPYNIKHLIDKNKNLLYIDNALVLTHSTATFQASISMHIFKLNFSSLPRYANMRLYTFKIWDNNTLVRDFIPVSYNGTPGLWDKVEWKFYGNAGTGSFTLGPEKASGVYHITEAPAYGVQWTENLSSTTLLRIGSHNLHRELPILSQFKGCVVNPSTKQVIYWLDENDWSKKADGTSSVLDGTDGLVMVHIPRFWGKSGKTGTTCWVKISPKYIDSTWQEIPEMFVGAYRATVSNSKAYSVVNTTTAFRGGNNRSAYDTYINSDPFRSDLGKPRTNLSRANMRTYCRNNNMEMLNYEYYKWIFYWCYVIEYANFNCLATFNSMLTNDGFRLGGLGSGVTTWSNTATSWSGYNATYPITPNGYCNDIGNRTGTKALTIPLTVNGSNTIASKTFYVPRWRGFDNPFGDTWTNLDGCNVQGDSAGNPKNVYTTTDPTKYADGTTSNMTLAGHIIHSDGYVKEFDLGTTGNIFAASVGGTETTYKCDYNYTGSKDTSFRWLLVGGHVFNGGRAGLGYLNSSAGVSAANSAVGFRPIVVV